MIFLYHSFGPELVARMLSRITDAVVGTDRVIFLIYENPVYGEMVDAITTFTRWYCETVSCSASEAGFAPDDDDTVVVWRIGGAPAISPPQGSTRPIVVTIPGCKAALAINQSA